MKETVLVTGAGGYIGRHVVTALLNQGYKVCAVDIVANQIDKRAAYIEYDIFSDDKNIYNELGCPDICIHLAWKDGFIHNSDVHISNLYKHYSFIKNMIEGGLKHISVMGTMHEVGYWEGSIDENTPTNPFSMYGVAKNTLRQATEILLKDKENITFQWLRAFYIYGDDIRNNSIFSKIIKMEQEGKETFPFTTGLNKYDFISVDELAKQIALASTQTEVTGIINCCTGKSQTLKSKVEEFLITNNFKIKPEYGVFPERPYDSPEIWGDAKKINSIISKK